MVYHAILFPPLRFTAGTLLVVTSFGLHDAHVAARQLLHTDEAVALGVTLLGLLAAITAENITGMDQFDIASDIGVEFDFIVAHKQLIIGQALLIEPGAHFLQSSLHCTLNCVGVIRRGADSSLICDECNS